jgi:hypothetical protein
MISRSAIDQQAEHIGSAVMTARVHHALALVDLPEVEIGDDLTLALAQRLAAHVLAFGRDDRCEAAARDRAHLGGVGILQDLLLLLGRQPNGRVRDEGTSLQRVLADVDGDLLREQVAGDRTRIHGRMNSSPSAISA